MHLKKRWIVFSIAIALVAILITTWWFTSQPRYETLLYAQIKLRRNDDTPKHWFFYEFDIAQKTELILRIEQPKEEKGEVFWKICNTTKETFLEALPNGTAWNYVYRDGSTGETFYKNTIDISKAGTHTFILMLAKWSPFEAVTANLELSIRAY